MYTSDDILNYHCPKWDELPDIGLYMDQVVSVLEKYLAVFAEDDDSKPITSTMINNYVKQKAVPSPQKKRYERVHLAYFFVLCILKRYLAITEISEGIARLLEKYQPQEVYEVFREEFEYSLKHAFSPDNYPPKSDDLSAQIEEIGVIRAVTNAYASILYARYLIMLRRPEQENAEANDKPEKKAEKKKTDKAAEQ